MCVVGFGAGGFCGRSVWPIEYGVEQFPNLFFWLGQKIDGA